MESLVVTLATWFTYIILFTPFALMCTPFIAYSRERRAVVSGICVIAAPLFAFAAWQSLQSGKLLVAEALFFTGVFMTNALATAVHAIILFLHRDRTPKEE